MFVVSFKSSTLTLALTCPSIYTDYQRYVYAKRENYFLFVYENTTQKVKFLRSFVAVKWPYREKQFLEHSGNTSNNNVAAATAATAVVVIIVLLLNIVNNADETFQMKYNLIVNIYEVYLSYCVRQSSQCFI